MKPALILLGAITLSALLWGLVIFAYLLYPAATLIGVFLLVLVAIGSYETGPRGSWTRWRRAPDDLLADVEERRAARSLYPTSERSVLGTPRDWGRSA